MKKLCILVIACVFVFSACGTNLSSDIFAVPEMPEMHKALMDSVDTVLADGFEYSGPNSGMNRQPLQLIDLDGDGESEGVVFLRDVLESHRTFIYVFEMTDEGFSLFDVIEGTEQELYTVSYSDVLGAEGYEMIAEWGTALEEEHTVTIYNQATDGMERLIEFTAERYSVNDFDGDGANEFIAVVDRKGKMYADIYSSAGGTIQIASSVELSPGGESVLQIKTGKATTDVSAVFIEREYGDGVITDVIARSGKHYVNLLPRDNICESRVLCADINSDGIIDIPRKAERDIAVGINDSCYRWENIFSDEMTSLSAFTYHSFTDNWFVMMPTSWMSSVHAERNVAGSGHIEICFSTRELVEGDVGHVIEADLFKIHIFKGDGQKNASEQDRRFEIYRREDTVFSAEIISDSYLGIKIDKQFFTDAFRIRESEWASEILFA